MTPRRAVFVFALLVAVLAAAVPAYAADDAKTERQRTTEARQHYKRGVEAFNAGRYEDAVTEFEKGYDLVPRSGFLLNIAHAERRRGDLRRARVLYKKYLAIEPEARQRDEVLGILSQLESAIEAEDGLNRGAAATPQPSPAPPTDEGGPVADEQPPRPVPTEIPLEMSDNTDVLSARPTPLPVPEHRPVYKRWWFWTASAAIVVGGLATGAYFLTRDSYESGGSLGTIGQR